jgi:hypothetical protein
MGGGLIFLTNALKSLSNEMPSHELLHSRNLEMSLVELLNFLLYQMLKECKLPRCLNIVL